MTDLDPLGQDARAVLDAAREGITPDPAALVRIRARVDVAVGATAAGGGIASVLAGKLGALAVVAVVVTGVALYASREPSTSTPIAFVPTGTADAPTRQTVRETAAVPAPIDRKPPSAAHPIDMPAMDLSTKPKPARKGVEHRAVELGREVALIDAAMAAMRRGDLNAALVSVRTHAAETAGTGQLAEDAAAIEVEALCKLGNGDVAQKKLAAFDARWPASAQRTRLSTSCP